MQGNRPLVIILALLALAGVVYTLRIAGNPDRVPRSGIPSRVVTVNGHPELHVDGKPFFMHSAAFNYYRMPRDRWEESLLALKQLGINTIDLCVIWNWHQPAEDSLDFDGKTNARRDLKGLLKLIADLQFKASVRPGPFIAGDWKNGGYPDWLLTRPEYLMPLKDILEGRYPRLSALQYEFGEEAAAEYLNNSTHLRYTRKWYQDVMGVVRPHLASHGGNVILLQVDDDQGPGGFNYTGPKFWEYLNLLRQYLREASGDSTIPIYFNPGEMRVTASSSAPPVGERGWAMGQYYQKEGAGFDILRAEDAGTPKYLAEILKTQSGFPPFFSEYQAGWFAGAEDVKAPVSDPTNGLLASRFLFQNGVKGLNYYPIQDTLYPAGYECPWSNYFYSWESAIGYEGSLRSSAEASVRNGKLISGMGPLLAATHYVADIGIAHNIGAYPQEKLTRDDISAVILRTMKATQYAQLNQVNTELVDFDHQSLQDLRRYRLILVPVVSESSYRDGRVPDYMEFSARAQSVLKEYVRQGGTLVAYPDRPKGRYLDELFVVPSGKPANSAAPAASLKIEGISAVAPGAIRVFQLPGGVKDLTSHATLDGDPAQVAGYRRKFGSGSAVVLGAEFDHWVPLQSASGTSDNALAAQPGSTTEENRSTGQILEALLKSAGVTRVAWAPELKRGVPVQRPYLSLIVANAFDRSGKEGAYGFLSIANFDSNPHNLRPAIRDPKTGEETALPAVHIAARDALMLPLRVGLKEELLGLGNQRGIVVTDELVYSTAEVTGVRADNNALLFELYSKGNASLRLQLSRAPASHPLIGGEKVDYRYYPATRHLDIDLPPPKSPDGRQTLSVPYSLITRGGPPQPASTSSTADAQPTPGSRRVDLRPTIRIPVRDDVAYDLFPAAWSARTGESVEFSFVHPSDCKGKCTAKASAADLQVSEVAAERSPAFTVRAPYERTYLRNLEWTLDNAGQSYSGTAQILLLAPGSAVALERDVDRDGFFDYILENDKLRLIIFPSAGARSFAFIRKDTNRSAFTSVGGMRDVFRVQVPDPPGHDRLPAWTRQGTPGMHNRQYAGQITQASGAYAEVALSYTAPDVAPKGAQISRVVRLGGNDDFVEVTYTIAPHDTEARQGYINLNSIALGSMEDEAATILRSDGSGAAPLKRRTKGSLEGATYVELATRDGTDVFRISWIPGSIEKVTYDRRDYSLLLALESPFWRPGEKSHSLTVRYRYGALTRQELRP
jgi:Glycosyl hydrolases family 35